MKMSKIDEFMSKIDSFEEKRKKAKKEQLEKLKSQVVECENVLKDRMNEVYDLFCIVNRLSEIHEKKIYDFLAYEIRGEGIHHKLGFDYEGGKYPNNDIGDVKEYLRREGGGACGNWGFRFYYKKGTFKYYGEMEPETIDGYIARLERITKLGEQFDELKEKIEKFVESL